MIPVPKSSTPRRRRGRRLTLLVTLLGAVVLATTAFACREALRDTFQIAGLRWGDEETAQAAAWELVAARCLRATPHLVERIRRAPGEAGRIVPYPGTFCWAPAGLEPESLAVVHLTPLAFALYHMGPEALPGVKRGLGRPRDVRLERIAAGLELAWSRGNKVVLHSGSGRLVRISHQTP